MRRYCPQRRVPLTSLDVAQLDVVDRRDLDRGAGGGVGRSGRPPARSRRPAAAARSAPSTAAACRARCAARGGPGIRSRCEAFDLDSRRLTDRHLLEIDRDPREHGRPDPADRDRLADRMRHLRGDRAADRVCGEDRAGPDGATMPTRTMKAAAAARIFLTIEPPSPTLKLRAGSRTWRAD